MTKAHKKEARGLAERLLERHLEHEMQSFSDAAFLEWITVETDHFYAWAQTQTVETLVSADQVMDTIRRNVCLNDIPAAVAEIAGEAASYLAKHELQSQTPLKDILSRKQFEEFVDKLLELKESRERGLHQLLDLPVYKDLISGVLYQAILRYINEYNALTRKIPGVSSVMKMGKQLVNKTAPQLEGLVEDSVRTYIAKNLGFLVKESQIFLTKTLTDEQLRQSALDVWDILEDKPVGTFMDNVSNMDLTELISLGYEFWLGFRKTPYFEESYRLVVECIYAKYGSQTLANLMDEFAVTPEKIRVEFTCFAPTLLESLRQSGYLEDLLRRRLASFYFDPATLTFLQSEREPSK
ncbi:MAG: hypothetical protein IPM37_22375 [Hahellaceae bacterium]|nr:hypothetical protein [Hahellaceae bacterium]